MRRSSHCRKSGVSFGDMERRKTKNKLRTEGPPKPKKLGRLLLL